MLFNFNNDFNTKRPQVFAINRVLSIAFMQKIWYTISKHFIHSRKFGKRRFSYRGGKRHARIIRAGRKAPSLLS